MTAVPLVDLSPWFSADPAARRQVATDVDRALCEVGTLLVTGHRVAAELADRVREEVRPFFALPTAEKAELACFPGGRGWLPPGEWESFTFGPETVPPAVLGTLEQDWFGPNSWPAARPGLRAAATAFADGCAALAEDLLRVLALALDLADDHFVRCCVGGPWRVDLELCPARQVPVAECTEVGTLTLRECTRGRQVRTADGAWVDFPEVPGALTVDAGDLLARWTGDRWRAAPHRLLPPPGLTGEEVTLVYSHAADPLTVVESLPTPAAGPTRYAPVTAGEFLRSRIDSMTVG